MRLERNFATLSEFIKNPKGRILLTSALSLVCVYLYLFRVFYRQSELREEKEMAKSKIVKANEKIAETVTGGFKKISDTVVGGYTKIEDAFVDRYLTKDGETVEEAKERLKKEQEALKKEI